MWLHPLIMVATVSCRKCRIKMYCCCKTAFYPQDKNHKLGERGSLSQSIKMTKQVRTPAACCSLPAALHSLPAAHRLLPTAHRLLLTTRCPQLSAHSFLPTACRSQTAAYRLLPTSCCPPLAAHCLLTSIKMTNSHLPVPISRFPFVAHRPLTVQRPLLAHRR